MLGVTGAGGANGRIGPVDTRGGWVGSVSEPGVVGVCCSNHCGNGDNMPASIGQDLEWTQLDGTYAITQHNGEPCNFFTADFAAGDLSVYCDGNGGGGGSCWASGVFFHNPSANMAGGDTGTRGISVWQPDMSMVKQSADYNVAEMAYTAMQNDISIDGDLVDWACSEYIAQTPFVPSGTQSAAADPVVFDEYAGGIWNGPADHSIAVAMNWNAGNLFIGAKVIDDTHQLSGASGWNGDSMQVVFANAERTEVTHLYNYAWDAAAGSTVHHHERGADGTECVVTRYEDDGATTYEVRIPATAWGLPADGAEAGMQLGVGICVNDGDTEAGQGGQKGWSGWGPYSAVYGKTAPATGVVTFSSDAPADCSSTTSAAVVQGSSELADWTPSPVTRSADGSFPGLTAPCGGEAGATGCATMTYSAPRVNIDLDGNLGDWIGTGEVFGQTAFLPSGTGCCGGALTVFDEYAGGIWNGVNDHSCAFSMAYDSTALYIGLKVVDDTHQLNGLSGWNGDSVQVVFANAERSSVTHLYNYAIGMETGEHVTHHERGPSETEAAITRYDCLGNCFGTTNYELKFPAAVWGLDNLASGAQAGIGLTINDGDTEAGQGGQKGWSGWGPYSAVYGKNAEECGLVTLW